MHLSRSAPPRLRPTAKPAGLSPALQGLLIVLGVLAFALLGLTSAFAQSSDETCAGVLATFTPTSVDGDQDAVAIVTQQLDADTPGWAQVSWQAAADTTLTGVTVQTESQTYTLVNDLATGTAENALQLTFCGTTTADTDSDGTEVDDPEPEGDDLQVTQPLEQPCTGVLATFTPTSVDGDQDAVAIVTQQLDADTPGWAQVSWQAAADTTLTGVTVQTESQTYTLVNDLATGTAENALQLTFCGTTTADTDGDTPPEEGTEDDGVVVVVPDPADQGATDPDDAPEEDAADGDDNAAGGNAAPNDDVTTAEDADGTGDATDEDAPDDDASSEDPGQDEPATADAPSDTDGPQDEGTTTDDTDEATAAETGDEAEDDTEVLGVQLNQEDDGGWGWQTPTLIALILAAAIGAGILVRNYYVSNQGGRP